MSTTEASAVEVAPPTIHRGLDDLPWVDIGGGSTIRLVRVDLATGVWVVHTRFSPGAAVQTHKHTGHVDAFTLSGSWHYLESPEAVNTGGSYLYEPAGSIHTLVVPASNTEVTEVWFTIFGANLNLDAGGTVEVVIDAHAMLQIYRALCEAEHGIADPPVIVIQS